MILIGAIGRQPSPAICDSLRHECDSARRGAPALFAPTELGNLNGFRGVDLPPARVRNWRFCHDEQSPQIRRALGCSGRADRGLCCQWHRRRYRYFDASSRNPANDCCLTDAGKSVVAYRNYISRSGVDHAGCSQSYARSREAFRVNQSRDRFASGRSSAITIPPTTARRRGHIEYA
jgi:hypothetical protein